MSSRNAVKALLARPTTSLTQRSTNRSSIITPKHARFYHHHSTPLLFSVHTPSINANENPRSSNISRRSMMTASSMEATLLRPTAVRRPTQTKYITINNHQDNIIAKRTLSYARVSHEKEYKEEMDGKHGAQLQLALDEGVGKDDEPFNPFDEYLLEEGEEEETEFDETEIVDADGNEMIEAEYVEKTDNSDDEELEEEEELKELDYDDEEEDVAEYENDGSMKRLASEKAALRAGLPAGGNFAIIEINGSQEKVTVDDLVIMNKLKPVDKWSVGSKITLTSDEGQILLMGNQDQTLVGLPFVNGGEVDVMVEEITRDKKVIVFKKKRRKNYRRTRGFSREVTFLRVLDIRFPASAST